MTLTITFFSCRLFYIVRIICDGLCTLSKYRFWILIVCWLLPLYTLTHQPSWSSSNLYQLLPSTTIHSILPIQIMCLAIFLHNLSLCPSFWSLTHLVVYAVPWIAHLSGYYLSVENCRRCLRLHRTSVSLHRKDKQWHSVHQTVKSPASSHARHPSHRLLSTPKYCLTISQSSQHFMH